MNFLYPVAENKVDNMNTVLFVIYYSHSDTFVSVLDNSYVTVDTQ